MELFDPERSGVDADFDQDGVSNLLEYAMGTNPKDPQSVFRAAPEIVNDMLRLTFPIRLAAPDVFAEAEASSDLEEWEPMVMSAGPLGQGVAWFEAEDVDAIAAVGPHRFARVWVDLDFIDTDADGLPDAWEILYGLDPFDASDALSDIDGDGVSALMEFLNGGNPTVPDFPDGDGNDDGNEDDPTGDGGAGGGGGGPGTPNTPAPEPFDSDGDGVVDLDDDYPNDNVVSGRPRSVAMSLRHYGRIDLANYATGPISGPFVELQLMAVDDLHTASFYIRETRPEESFGWHHHHHHVHTFTKDFTVRTHTLKDSRIKERNGPHWINTNFSPTAISPKGTLVGVRTVYEGDNMPRRGFAFRMGSLSLLKTYRGADNDGRIFSALELISMNEVRCGHGSYIPSGQHEPKLIAYARNSWRTALDENASWIAVAPGGSAIRLIQDDASAHLLTASGAIPIESAGTPAAVNDGGIVVGTANDTGAPSALGTIWRKNQDGTLLEASLLAFEIPITVQQQLFVLSPFSISNRSDILGTGSVLIGEGAGSVEAASIFVRPDSDFLTHPQRPDAAIISMGDSIAHWIYGQNNSGTLIVREGSRPKLAIPVEFQPVNILHGFDYPMLDDRHPGQAADQESPQWWTSVARADVSGRGLNVNHNVKVVFASSDAAKLCKIRVRPGSEDLISVSPSTPSGTETLLTITGKDPETRPDQQRAFIEVVTKDSMQQLLQTLSVDVLPELVIPVRISLAYDGTYPSGNNPTMPWVTEADFPAVIAMLNECFRQAAVHFTLHPESGPHQANYDLIRDGMVNDSGVGGETEIGYIGTLGQTQPDLVHIAIVARIDPALQLLGLVESHSPTVAIVGADNCGLLSVVTFIAAHEVGHVLNLSTRSAPPWHAGSVVSQHDVRMVPRRYRAMPLMFPIPFNPEESIQSQLWLRSEDWREGNLKAMRFQPQ